MRCCLCVTLNVPTALYSGCSGWMQAPCDERRDTRAQHRAQYQAPDLVACSADSTLIFFARLAGSLESRSYTKGMDMGPAPVS